MWITLLVTCLGTLQSLENKGFGRIAWKKSNPEIPYKSMTYRRYWFCSGKQDCLSVILRRINIFVHK